MVIKIQGNRICENDLHVWILVSNDSKGWVDVATAIDTPKFDTIAELESYIDEKKGLIERVIQGKWDKGRELKHYDVVVDRPELINDDSVLKEIEKEKKIEKKLRELAIKALEKEKE